MAKFIVTYQKMEIKEVEADDFRSAYHLVRPLGEVGSVRKKYAPDDQTHFVMDHCAICSEPFLATEGQSDSCIKITPSNYEQLQKLSELPLFQSFVCKSCFLKSGSLGCE